MPAKQPSRPVFKIPVPKPDIETKEPALRDRLHDQHQEGRTLRSKEIVGMFAISPRQLQWWDERKFLSPAHDGHHRQYSIGQAVMIGVMVEMRKTLTLGQMRRTLRQIEREICGSQVYFPDYLAVVGGKVSFSSDCEEIVNFLSLQAGAGRPLVVPLLPILQRIHVRLNQTGGRKNVAR